MKRDRDAEEIDPEFMEAFREAWMKKRKKEQEGKSVAPVQDLTHAFNAIMKDIVSEEGFQVKAEENDLLHFSATFTYPNEIDYLEIYPRLYAVDQGVAWIECLLSQFKEIKMSIYYTKSKPLRLAYHEKHLKELEALKTQPRLLKSPPQGPDTVYMALAENLKLANVEPIFNNSRPPVEGVRTVTVVVAVEKSIKSPQLQKIFAAQAGKIKNIRIDPHPDEPFIRVFVDILYEAN